MIRQEKDCGIRASGIREVLGGKIRDDGGDHFVEAPSDPAGRIGLSVTVTLIHIIKCNLLTRNPCSKSVKRGNFSKTRVTDLRSVSIIV
jgi:hypothetical protein